REICRKAGANIAAVNYYFRDKERLYLEAVKLASCGQPGGEQVPQWPAGMLPAGKLRDFIHLLVRRMLDPSRPASHTHLMMREMAWRTEACTEWVRDYVRPMSEVLLGILAEVLPTQTPHYKRFLTAASIVGQCLHHVQNKPVIALLLGPEDSARL